MGEKTERVELNAATLRLAFWEAMKRCDNDERVDSMDMPCFSRSGESSLVDGYLPDELWEHMKQVIQELKLCAATCGGAGD